MLTLSGAQNSGLTRAESVDSCRNTLLKFAPCYPPKTPCYFRARLTYLTSKKEVAKRSDLSQSDILPT